MPLNQLKYIALVGPSGSGKNTLRQLILANFLSIQGFKATTSKSKPTGNLDSSAFYNYLTRAEFQSKIGQSDFVEYEEYNGDYYGTDLGYIKTLQNNFPDMKCIIFDIDYRGANSLKKYFGKDYVTTIFIKPPSLEILKYRLIARSRDSLESIKARIEIAKKELEQADNCDYTITNNTLEQAQNEVFKILKSLGL